MPNDTFTRRVGTVQAHRYLGDLPVTQRWARKVNPPVVVTEGLYGTARIDGLPMVLSGQWIVVDDGRVLVVSDSEFRNHFAEVSR